MATAQTPRPQDLGSYIDLNGQRLRLIRHPTDFSVIGHTATVHSDKCKQMVRLTPTMRRITAVDPAMRDSLMAEIRQTAVAHHIYCIEGTEEEIVIDDHIILTLEQEGTGLLEAIAQEFHLIPAGRMGQAHVLQVTAATGRNPLKVANEIATRTGVAACHPQVLLALERHGSGASA